MSDDAPHITGFFVRAKRGDRWLSLDIANLSDEELADFFTRQGGDPDARWAKALAGWIRDAYRNGRTAHIKGADV